MTVLRSILGALIALTSTVSAIDNGLGLTPPMVSRCHFFFFDSVSSYSLIRNVDLGSRRLAFCDTDIIE